MKSTKLTIEEKINEKVISVVTLLKHNSGNVLDISDTNTARLIPTILLFLPDNCIAILFLLTLVYSVVIINEMPSRERLE